MKKILIIIILISGCYSPNEYDALYNFKCTEAQMEKVKKETIFCQENIAPLEKTNCYPSAISRNCSRIKKSKD